MDDRYWLAIDSQQTGPFSFSQLQDLWRSGALAADAFYWQEGFPQWIAISSLADRLGPPVAQAPPPPSMPVRAGNLQRPSPKTSALAVWSLVLGILGLFVFSIFAAIPGVICGHKALGRIKRSGGALAGQGLAFTGLVTGYLAMVMLVFLAAIVIPNFIKARDAVRTTILNSQNAGQTIIVSRSDAGQRTIVRAGTQSHMNACINNLRLIDSAKQQWALEHHKQNRDTPKMEDLRPYIGRGPNGEMPACPDGGEYKLGTVGEKPTCSIPGHVLP